MNSDANFREWVMLEIMGHRRLFGRLEETDMPGNLYRLDVFFGDDSAPSITQFYAPSAVYSISPISEDLARKMAETYRPEPVARYELPAANYHEQDNGL